MADEVFISYSHHDRAWAEKLATDLRGRGVTVFFDQKSLREGEGWDTVTLLDPYVAPRPVSDVSLNARLGIGVDDMGEVRRLLKSSISECLRLRVAAAKPAAAALAIEAPMMLDDPVRARWCGRLASWNSGFLR